MALIDVSELMTDPDFINNFQVIRRCSHVDIHGHNILTPSDPIPTVGSVQAGDGNTLLRLPDKAQLSQTKTVYTKTLVTADPTGGYADIMVINGLRYEVKNVMPWNNYGAGYYRVDVVQEKPSI